MPAVGKIVDDHDARARFGHGRFEADIEPVMVYDQPVDPGFGDEPGENLGFILPVSAQPGGVDRALAIAACGKGQGMGPEAGGLDEGDQVAGMGAAGKGDLRALPGKHARQGEASHDVAGADGQRRIGTEQHLHSDAAPLMARNSSSARSQSSGVSMSTTRHSGSTMVLPWVCSVSPASQASRRPQ